MGMRIGELARRTGVGVSTLRAWEHRFRFLEAQRSPAGHRLYRETDVERVEAVLRLVSEGLTLQAAVARVSSMGTGALPGGEGEALLFGQILQVANQGVWVSRDGRTRYANRKMAELMGCSLDDLLARPVQDFHQPDAVQAVRERGKKVRAGDRLTFTQELLRADGSTFLAQITTTPLFSQAGQYEGAVALVEDVTDRMEAETEARFRNALLDAIGEAVLAARPDGTIVYANAAAERLLGWRVTELIGENGLEFLAPQGAMPRAASFHEKLLSKKHHAAQVSLARRDGTQVLAQVTGSPVLDGNRELVGLIGVLRDDSDRDRLEHELRTWEQQAETVAVLGTRALRSSPCDQHSVLTQAVEATRRALQSDSSALIEILPGSGHHAVRETSPHDDEPGTVPSGSRSLSGYTAHAGKVVVVDDAAVDRRFDLAPRPVQFGIRSAIAAPVFGPEGVCGVLIAASRQPRMFDPSSAHFIQGIANVVGIALQRS